MSGENEVNFEVSRMLDRWDRMVEENRQLRGERQALLAAVKGATGRGDIEEDLRRRLIRMTDERAEALKELADLRKQHESLRKEAAEQGDKLREAEFQASQARGDADALRDALASVALGRRQWAVEQAVALLSAGTVEPKPGRRARDVLKEIASDILDWVSKPEVGGAQVSWSEPPDFIAGGSSPAPSEGVFRRNRDTAGGPPSLGETLG